MKKKFDTVEAFIMGQKYNPLNRKAKKVQSLVTAESKVFIPYKGIVVIVKTEEDKTVTTTVSGSVFFPTVETKSEPSYKG